MSSNSPEQSYASKRKRIRNFTADDRAVHREVEKSRREAFRVKLNALASLLPDLSHTDPKKLSKHTVVDSALSRLQRLGTRLTASKNQIVALQAERDELLAELNLFLPNRIRTAKPLLQETIDCGLLSTEAREEAHEEEQRAAGPSNSGGDETTPEDMAPAQVTQGPGLPENELAWDHVAVDGFPVPLWDSIDHLPPPPEAVRLPMYNDIDFMPHSSRVNEVIPTARPAATLPVGDIDDALLVIPDSIPHDWNCAVIGPPLASEPRNWSNR